MARRKFISIEDVNKLGIVLGDYEKIIVKAAEDSVKKLRSEKYSPKGVRKKKTYRKGWEFQLSDDKKYGFMAYVRNKDNYQLTHLLNNGHLIVNKKSDVGWSPKRTDKQWELGHINRVYLGELPMFIQSMSKIGVRIKLK